jgi:hypothetical protein
MDKAIEQIVDPYVRLQNRKALEDLRSRRRGLLSDLKGRSDSVYGMGGATRQLDDELAVIQEVERRGDRWLRSRAFFWEEAKSGSGRRLGRSGFCHLRKSSLSIGLGRCGGLLILPFDSMF